MRIEIDSPDLQRLVLDIAATDKEAERALNSTLRKMASWLRARSIKGLSQSLQIQQKVVRRRLRTFRLQKTASGSSVTVWYGLDPVAMIYLGAKQTGRGVSASGGRFVKSGFIAKMANGKKQVFKRQGKGRLPIDRQQAEVQDQSHTWIEDRLLGGAAFEAQFIKTFEHELQWQTR